MTAESTAERKPVLAALPRISQTVRRAGTAVLLAGLVYVLLYNLVKSPEQFVSVTLLGITYGSVYALVALGYTLVYGIIELINFAHGDVFMWGTMLGITVAVSWFGLDGDQSSLVTAGVTFIALAFAATVCGVGNTVIERFAYRPLRNAPKLAPLITAVGMSYILQNLARGGTGRMPRLPRASGRDTVLFRIGGYPYYVKSALVTLITIPVPLALVYLVQRTRQGKAMRATAQDLDAARMMGIDIDRTIAFTFLLAGSLAGAGGVLFVFWQTSTKFDLGFQLGLFAFTAAVLGGIGNLKGAALGGLLIGLTVAYNDGLSFMSSGSSWTQSVIFTC